MRHYLKNLLCLLRLPATITLCAILLGACGGNSNSDAPISADRAAYNAALATFDAGNFAAAEAAFKQFPQDYPGSKLVDDAEYYVGRAVHEMATLGMTGYFLSDARAIYQQVVAGNLNKADNAQFQIGRTYFDEGSAGTTASYATALIEFAKVLDTDLFTTPSVGADAQYYIGRTKHEMALLNLPISGAYTLQNARDEYDKLLGVLYLTSTRRDDAQYQIGKTYYDAPDNPPLASNYDTAMLKFQKVLDTYGIAASSADNAQYFLARSIHERALLPTPPTEISLGAARNAYTRLMDVYPLSGRQDDAHYQIGRTYFDENNFDDALAAFQAVLIPANYTAPSIADDAQFYIGRAKHEMALLITPLPSLAPVRDEYNQILTLPIYATSNRRDDAQLQISKTYLDEENFAAAQAFLNTPLPDTAPPTVVSTLPAHGVTGFAVDGVLSITFSEAMLTSSLNTTTFTLTGTSGSVAGTVSYSGNTATFTPSNPLAFAATYTATLTTAAKDTAGNALANNYAWTISTVGQSDSVSPTVVSVSPIDTPSNVPVNTPITVTFSENMHAATINASTFTVVSSTSGSVAGAITYSGTTATFVPSGTLTPSTTYTATVTAAVKDVSGNALAADRVWSFTTSVERDTTAPTVTVTSPTGGATGVPVNTSIAATFSENMLATSLNASTFTLSSAAAGSVVGAVTYSGTTATFVPGGALAFSTIYTATLTAGAQDIAGNPLTNHVWSFTTEAAPPPSDESVYLNARILHEAALLPSPPAGATLQAARDEYNKLLTQEIYATSARRDDAQYQIGKTYFEAAINPDYAQALLEFEKVFTGYAAPSVGDDARYYIGRTKHEMALLGLPAGTAYTLQNARNEYLLVTTANFPGSARLDDAQYQIGRTYFSENNFAAALTAFDAALAIVPLSVGDDAQFYRARSIHERALLPTPPVGVSLDVALIEYGKVNVTHYPGSNRLDDAQYQIGRVYFDQANYASALTAFQAVLSTTYPSLSVADDAQYYIGRTKHEMALLGLPAPVAYTLDNARTEYLKVNATAYPGSTRLDDAQYQMGKTHYDALTPSIGNYDSAIAAFDLVFSNYTTAASSADDAQYFKARSIHEKALLATPTIDTAGLVSARTAYGVVLTLPAYALSGRRDDAQYQIGKTHFDAGDFNFALPEFNAVLTTPFTTATVKPSVGDDAQFYKARSMHELVNLQATNIPTDFDVPRAEYAKVNLTNFPLTNRLDDAAFWSAFTYHDSTQCDAEWTAMQAFVMKYSASTVPGTVVFVADANREITDLNNNPIQGHNTCITP